MNGARRLQYAPHRLQTQVGRTAVEIAKSYWKSLGVDWPCAIQERGALGIRLDPRWIAQLHSSLEAARQARLQQEERRDRETEGYGVDSDEHSAYIVGYTPGGTLFGLPGKKFARCELRSVCPLRLK